MKVSRAMFVIVPVLLAVLACSQAGPVNTQGPSYSTGFLQRLEPHVEFTEALALIDKGACAEALPLLNLYVSQKQEPGIVHYLLGRAYICSGDFLKGAVHLQQARREEASLTQEVNGAALLAVGLLSKKLVGSSARSFEALKALHTLYSLSGQVTMKKADRTIVLGFVDRLLKRGDYEAALQVIHLMSRLGTPQAEIVGRQVHGLARLGREEEIHSLIQRTEGKLGDSGYRVIYDAAKTAESSFRPGIAAFLFQESQRRGETRPLVWLDIARNLLKSGEAEKAKEAYGKYLSGTSGEEQLARHRNVAELLDKYDRIDEALQVLESGKKSAPDEFAYYLSLALLEKKAPGQIRAVDQMSGYLDVKGHSREALEAVGTALLDRKMRNTGKQVFSKAGAEKKDEDLVQFYLGCFHYLDREQRVAFSRFDQAVARASAKGDLLRRIAAFLTSSGNAKQAEEYLEKALKMAPGSVEVLLELATLKEDRKAGRGMRLVEKSLSRLSNEGKSLVHIASWCEKRGYRTRALKYAAAGAHKETGSTIEGHLYYARLLLSERAIDKAVKVYAEASEKSTDPAAFAAVLFVDAGEQEDPRVACFVYNAGRNLAKSGALSDGLVEAAAVASLRCGKPDRSLLERAIFAGTEAGAAIRRLLQVSFDDTAVRMIMDIVSSRSDANFRDPALAADLCVLFASGGLSDRAVVFARQYATATSDNSGEMQAKARTVLFHGASKAAGIIMAVAWQKATESDREKLGLLYAAHLLTQGEDKAAGDVISALIELPGKRKELSAAAASLLIDAGKPGLAEQILFDALRLPESDGDSSAPSGLKEFDPESADLPLTPETLARMLSLKDKAPSPQNVRRNLVALVTFAWQLQGKSWGELVDRMMPLIQPWHGEPYLAKMLQRVSATALAVELFEAAFKKSPADFELLKGYVDALTYENFSNGRPHLNVGEKVEWAVNRFVKARESDSDAYRQAADYLTGKGFFAAAEKLFVELAETGQINAAIALSLGRARLSLGLFDDAMSNFRQAATLAGCGVDTLDLIGQEMARVGRDEQQLALLRECAQRYPRDAQLRMRLATALYATGTDKARQEALVEFKKSVALDSGLVLNVATILVPDGGVDALAFVRLLLTSPTPERVKEGLKLGFELAAAEGDIEMMKNLGSKVARTHRSNLQMLSELAGLYFKYNLPDQGIAKLKVAAKKGDPFFSLLLGVRLVTAGKKKAGLKQFRFYLERDLWKVQPTAGLVPNDRYNTFVAQVDFLADAGLLEDSTALLSETVERFPSDHRLRLKLANLLLAAKQWEKAVEQLAASGHTFPVGAEQQETRRILQVLRDAGRLDQALTKLEFGFASGGSGGLVVALAAGYAMAGHNAKLGRLMALQHKNGKLRPLKLLMLAQILLDFGRYELAERTLGHVLSKAWGRSDLLTPAHRMLCSLYSATGRQDQIDEATRLVLLQIPSDTEFRMQIARHFFENEYASRAQRQFNLADLYEEDNLEARTSLFALHIRLGDRGKARALAFRTAFQGERVLNILLAFASISRKKLEFSLALDLYEKALELDGSNLPLLFAVAELALVTGDKAKSVATFERFLGAGPGRVGRAAEVIQNAIKYGHLGLANSVARSSGTRSHQVLVQRGLALLSAGKQSEGEALLMEAASLEEKNSALLLKVLSSHAHRPYLLPEKVVNRIVRQACAAQFAPPACRFWDGIVELRQGDAAQALRSFSAQLTGTSETWYYTIGAFKSLVRHGHADKAASLLKKTMVGYKKEQVLNEAMKALFSLVEEPGLSADVLEQAGTLVQKYLDELLAADPYDFWLRTQAAEIRLLTGDKAGGRKVYEEALKQSPWIAGIYNNLAYLLSQLNLDLERGVELVTEALRREPSHSSFYLDTLGWLRYRQGDLAEAEKQIRHSLARVHLGYGESLAESLYHLGVVLKDQSKDEEAVYQLGLASFLDPYGRYGRKSRELLEKMGHDPYHLEE